MFIKEQKYGKSILTMAGLIISLCRRTWSQERRIGVLPYGTLWDCVPEHVIDAQLEDTVYEGQILAIASLC